MTKIEKLMTDQYKAGYDAARRDSIKHIRHAYALGQEVGRLEKLLEMHNDEDVRDSRHGEGRPSDETMVEERSESSDSEKSERTERDERWVLHGFANDRPAILENHDRIDTKDENEVGLIDVVPGEVYWKYVKYWRYH